MFLLIRVESGLPRLLARFLVLPDGLAIPVEDTVLAIGGPFRPYDILRNIAVAAINLPAHALNMCSIGHSVVHRKKVKLVPCHTSRTATHANRLLWSPTKEPVGHVEVVDVL